MVGCSVPTDVTHCNTKVVEGTYLPDHYSDCKEGQVLHSSGVILTELQSDNATVHNECSGSIRVTKFSVGPDQFGPWRSEVSCGGTKTRVGSPVNSRPCDGDCPGKYIL